MTVSTKKFSTLVDDQAAAITARASVLVDFTEGSILLALIESAASQGLWLESQALQVLAVTRAATSNGPDLDSFVGDFGLTRNPAVGSVGSVTFARFTDTASALIPVNPTPAQVQTADGLTTFNVVEDDANTYWNAGLGGYLIPALTASITVPIAAASGGSATNVVAGAITLILSAISGVDTVTNAAPTTEGTDADTDAALRLRFQLFIASLASATKLAIETAALDVPGVKTVQVNENENYDSSSHLGYFTVIIDDGTGSPSGALITAVTAAVDAVRGCCIGFGVFGPTVVTINVVGTIDVAAGYSGAAVEALAAAAITAYINGLGLGVELVYTRVYQVMFDASPGLTDVTALTLNGVAENFYPTPSQVVRVGTMSIT